MNNLVIYAPIVKGLESAVVAQSHYRISRIIGHSSSSEASVVVLVAAQPARNRKRIPVKEILKDMGYSFR